MICDTVGYFLGMNAWMKPPCSSSQKWRPVSTLAREGAHDGAVVKPLVNNTPSFATRSNAGVGSFDQP